MLNIKIKIIYKKEMAGLHLIKTYSSDSDEDKHDEEKEDDDKITN